MLRNSNNSRTGNAMAKTFAQLTKEIEELTAKADAVRKRESAGVVARIREAIAAYGISAADLGFAEGRGAGSSGSSDGPVPARKMKSSVASAGGGKARVAYGDAAGNTWSGRGPRPRWLKSAIAEGRTLESLMLGGGAEKGASAESAAMPAAKKGRAAKRAKKAPIAAKFRGENGETWSGRGPTPRWLKEAIASGKTPDDLRAG
jgi:DNA-binding protein H-NS